MTEQVNLPSETEFFKLLEDAGGGYVEALHKLMRKAQKEIDKREGRSTVAGRKAIWKKAIVEFDEEKLLEMQEEMSNFVDHVASHPIVPGDEPRELTKAEATELMRRFLAFRQIDEFLTVNRSLIRAMVFQHITEEKAKELDHEGNPIHEDPEHVNGSIVVEELGKKFTKEGCGRKDPSIDEEKLKKALGDRWCEVVDVIEVPEQIIEAHCEVVFNEAKLGKLMMTDPSVMELVREAVVPGAWKPAKFWVRDVK